jgi:hypothetical protein
MVYEYTEAELLDILTNAITFGISIGIIVGILLGVFLIYIMRWSNDRNFKMYLLHLKDEKRDALMTGIENAMEEIDDIISNSNSKTFRDMYNRLNRLKCYIEKKWVQN